MSVASFHLVNDAGAFANLLRLPRDRMDVGSVAGLEFAAVLGTARDGRVGNSFQPSRRALFGVWSDDGALERFMVDSPIARRWEAAEEAWHVRMHLIGGHGRWRSTEPLATVVPAGEWSGPVVTVTRAAVAPTAVRRFLRRARAIDRSEVRGLRRITGFGEVPLLRIGTIGVWDDADAVREFTHASDVHVGAMSDARRDAWFSESLFARFAPYASTGTWTGQDPMPELSG